MNKVQLRNLWFSAAAGIGIAAASAAIGDWRVAFIGYPLLFINVFTFHLKQKSAS
ncbi:hypothetical protein Q5741_20210 [Paenibacillus sp. JX-17]|uniref:MFS transporter n=1 Tax=Paenibacillus lacisoli TaxID=3064525 RepID=A0ABT9CM89_9BACL|nr:hypothetical protein [Paenibacillus sp. JX-17]MDO7908713.1 hypothetical protein [Paenibacillus sp. JX-17]